MPLTQTPPRIAQGVSQQARVAVVVVALEFLARFQNDVFATAILGEPQRADFTDDFLRAWPGGAIASPCKCRRTLLQPLRLNRLC